ncbi:hypothetical protein M885DRAFT_526878 [Pelagophyceae sp. CCMP2097]|nr:hypothetical protein M885DRAFT_526878 [Pelagophyceae sp. CCMP2097]|mmetsp:Transcript_32720/g.110194  ORF Transcript_32720/g.110194 Transcript_32720/m.110194 type:complete len:252 (+) Transcript_32720:74-829(+)
MTTWPQVAACWKSADGGRFDGGVLEKCFPAAPASKAFRVPIWHAMDSSGTGVVSLAKFDEWFLRATLNLERKHGVKPVDGKSTVFVYVRPALIRAFALARGCAPAVSVEKLAAASVGTDGFVTSTEVAILLLATQHVLHIFRLFDEMDTSNDRRLDRTEWDAKLELANAELRNLGYMGKEVKSDDFLICDADAGGMVLLSEAVFFFLNKSCFNATILKRNAIVGPNPTGVQGDEDKASAKGPKESKACIIL